MNATMMVGRYKKTCGLVIDIILFQYFMRLECTAMQHMLIAVEANTSDEAFKAFGVQERLMP